MITQMETKHKIVIGACAAVASCAIVIGMCGAAYMPNKEVNNLIENQTKIATVNDHPLTDTIELKNSRENDYSAIQELINVYGQYLTEDEMTLLLDLQSSLNDISDIDTLHQKMEIVTVLTSVCNQRQADAVAAAEAEAARIAEEEAEAAALAEQQTYYSSYSSSSYSSGSDSDLYSAGVIYNDGYKYTWYSSNVLPHWNLSAWSTDEEGYYTEDGMRVVASSDYANGTILETEEFGTLIVRDSGCASGTIDMYTNW